MKSFKFEKGILFLTLVLVHDVAASMLCSLSLEVLMLLFFRSLFLH